MMFSTGNTAQTDTATVTLSVPVIHDGEANDYVLDALVACLTALASPFSWNSTGYTETQADAAANGQSMLDSMTIVWP